MTDFSFPGIIAGTPIPRGNFALPRPGAWKSKFIPKALCALILGAPAAVACAETFVEADRSRHFQKDRMENGHALMTEIHSGSREIIGTHISPGVQDQAAVRVWEGVELKMTGATVQTVSFASRGVHFGPSEDEPHDDKPAAGSLEIKDSKIETKGVSSPGIFVDGLPAANVLNNSSVSTHGGYSNGVHVSRAAMDITGSTLQTQADGSHALYVDDSAGGVTVEDRTKIRTAGVGSAGLNANNSKVLMRDSEIATSGLGGAGVLGAGSVVRLVGSRVQTQGSFAWGAVLTSSALEVDGGSIESDRYGAILVSDAAEGDSYIQLKGDARVEGGNGVFVRFQKERDILNGFRIGLSGTSMATGDILSQANGKGAAMIDVSIADTATWKGGTQVVDRMALSQQGRWLVNGDSSVGSLSMDGGVVEFEPGTAFQGKTLTIKGDLGGKGEFRMNTNLAEMRGDKIRIEGKAEGEHRVMVANTGAEPKLTDKSLRLIEASGGAAKFSLANRRQVVEAGVYQYRLDKTVHAGDGSVAWSLRHAGKLPAEPGGVTGRGSQPIPDVTPSSVPEPVARPVAVAALSSQASAVVNTGDIGTSQLIWNAEMQLVSQRLHDVRHDANKTGVWMNGVRAHQRIDNGLGRKFSQKARGLELGADREIRTEGGRWVLGALAGYTRADRGFGDEGKGKTDSYHGGGYASYLHDNGVYADAVASANHFRNSYASVGSDGGTSKGRYANNGMGLSLQAGRRFDFEQGWFIDPQAGVDFFRMNGAAFRGNDGMDVRVRGGHSLQLRAGARLGRAVELDNGRRFTPYVKLGVVRELVHTGGATANGIALNTGIAGSRVEVGAGVSANLGKDHSMFVDYGYAKGSKYSQPWSVSAGYRYMW